MINIIPAMSIHGFLLSSLSILLIVIAMIIEYEKKIATLKKQIKLLESKK